MDDKLILTTVYGRRVLIHMADNDIAHIRVITDNNYRVGTIAVGRICKMLPSSNACFVDIGDDEQYFLQLPVSLNEIHFADGQKHTKVHPEDRVIVQVSAEAVKTKSPSVSGMLSLTGTYAVAEPGNGLSFSKKLDKAARAKLALPEDTGDFTSRYHIIIRTAASEVKDSSDIRKDISLLCEELDEIRRKSAIYRGSGIIFSPPGMIESTLAEWKKYPASRLITDESADNNELEETVNSVCPGMTVEHYNDSLISLIKLYKLETLIDNCLAARVYLKSGGFLIIEQGETLTAIDVNTAHATGGSKEETSFKTNLEAAEKIAAVMQSRNLSGMILIDFINMKDPDHTRALIENMKKNLTFDDVRSSYVDMTGLGLMEITRQRKYSTFAEQWKKPAKVTV